MKFGSKDERECQTFEGCDATRLMVAMTCSDFTESHSWWAKKMRIESCFFSGPAVQGNYDKTLSSLRYVFGTVVFMELVIVKSGGVGGRHFLTADCT